MAKQLVRRLLPDRLWVFLRESRDRAIIALRRACERAGYNVARRGDYYSPLPVVSDLAANVERWNRPSRLSGVRVDLPVLQERLGLWLERWQDEFCTHPGAQEIKARRMGPGFPDLDALTLYAALRESRPAQYLEVGSGVSTWFARLALARNALEGDASDITCIEPNPYPGLRALPGIELEVRPVQDVPLARFEALRENDVLFIDSSHVVRIDGDVPFLFLEVLPRLAPGVRVHVHDVPFPYNVPQPAERWVLEPSWPMFWNEAMLLQAFLCNNERVEIWMSTPLIRSLDEPFLRKSVAGYRPLAEDRDPASSCWLRIVG